MVIAGNLTFILFLWLAAIVASAYLTYRRQNRQNKKLLNFVAWFNMQLQHPVRVGRNPQTGEVDMGGIILLGIGMVFLSIGFIFLKLTTDASTTLLTYVYSGNATITAATFTGYKAFVGLTPLLVLLGYETSAVITGFMGIQVMQGNSEARASKGTTLLMALSIVFIAIGLIIEPITLDGVASTLDGDGQGVSSAFTGYVTFLKMSPMLVHLGFIVASVITGFFGIKLTGKGT